MVWFKFGLPYHRWWVLPCLIFMLALFPLDALADSSTANGLQNTFLAGTPVSIYLPEKVRSGQSLQLLITLHGINGNGGVFGQGMLEFARQNNLALLAPTFNYNPDWQNPPVVAEEDANLTRQLNQIINEFGQTYRLKLKNRVMLYGFSRGAQLAHRYALLYPEKTLAAVVLSAGSYTLPLASKGANPLPFPLGISDLPKYTDRAFNLTSLKKVNFLVGCGGDDTDSKATPPAWDAYIGKGRLERAQSFYQALQQVGVKARFTAFPGVGHQETAAMREAAAKFFRAVVSRPAPPEADATYFVETGHNLSGAFKRYWDKFGGLAQFGYPITEVFNETNNDDGKVYQVQYFERARFELHPEFAGTDYEVLLGLLGKQIAPKEARASQNNSSSDSVYFAETGHNLNGAFYSYWLKHGGLPIYGYPLTEPFYERNPDDGKTYLVQYFERNRFEFHPENSGTNYEVLLGLLGSTSAEQRGLLEPILN